MTVVSGSVRVGESTYPASATLTLPSGAAVAKYVGANGGADGVAGQSTAQFASEQAKFGNGLRLVKLFYSGALPSNWAGSAPAQMCAASPGVVPILCWNTAMSSSALQAFANSIPAGQVVGFSWQSEPEAAMTASAWQSGWTSQAQPIKDLGKANLVNVTSVAGYEYGPTGTGFSGAYVKGLSPHPDWWGIDTYQHEKGGAQSGITTWPAQGLATAGWSFDVWRQHVIAEAGSNAALALCEYGVDNCLEATSPGMRNTRLKQDVAFLRTLPNVVGWLYWDHTMSTTSCNRQWKLTSAAEISTWQAIVDGTL